jgi:hypothetical protein
MKPMGLSRSSHVATYQATWAVCSILINLTSDRWLTTTQDSVLSVIASLFEQIAFLHLL